MPEPIEDTLSELDSWYNELPGGTSRPQLLSKLAMLEFCGWIELRMDELVRMASNSCHVDATWVEENLIERTSGFTYQQHFRIMLCRIVGEVFVLKIETALEAANVGDLDRLKAALSNYWVIRNSLAHTNTGAAVTKQVTLNAPSWAINQQRVLGKLLAKYEVELRRAAVAIGAMP